MKFLNGSRISKHYLRRLRSVSLFVWDKSKDFPRCTELRVRQPGSVAKLRVEYQEWSLSSKQSNLKPLDAVYGKQDKKAVRIAEVYRKPDKTVEFIAEVAYPYPCWLRNSISQGRRVDFRLLQDTFHTVQKAMAKKSWEDVEDVVLATHAAYVVGLSTSEDQN